MRSTAAKKKLPNFNATKEKWLRQKKTRKNKKAYKKNVFIQKEVDD